MSVKKLYKHGKTKALTLSYDDGICQDIRLVDILNKYSIKATFNLNSGLQKDQTPWGQNQPIIYRLEPEKLPELYKGHEIAMHMVNHPHPTQLSDTQVEQETILDKQSHEELFGCKVRGLAYPFGDYDDRIVEILRRLGVAYARTVGESKGFSLPNDFLKWDSTCHHINAKLMELADEFLETKGELALFYLWGHSYEFDVNKNWNVIEDFCEKVSGKAEIWYASNIEIYDYIAAMNRLTLVNNTATNNSEKPLWLEVNGKIIELLPHTSVAV